MRYFALVTTLTAAVLACGDGGSGPPAPVATVTVTPNPVDLEVDSTVQLTVTLKDASGNTLTGRPIVWSSEANSIATVDANGVVTGVAEGSANIAATSEGKVGKTITRVIPTATGAKLVSAIFGPGGKVPTNVLTIYYKDLIQETWEKSSLDPGVFSPGGLGIWFGLGGGGFQARVTAAAGRALFLGGIGGGNIVATRSAVLFDPETRSAVELEMAAARLGHALAPLSASRVLIVGGDSGTIGAPGSIKTLSSAEIFDLTTMQFTPTGSMAEARSRHAAAPLPDGRVLVTGGLVPTGVGSNTIDVASAEVFDPATGAFTPTGSMGAARAGHSAIALDDGRVLVLGGFNLKSAEVYDPASGTFSPVSDTEVGHGSGHRAVKLLDGRVLVLGGDGGTIQPTAVAEVFDPATDGFTRIDDMTTTRMLHAAVLLADGRVLIAGGQNAEGDVIASAETYDPATNTFTAVDDMPLPGSEQAAVGIVP